MVRMKHRYFLVRTVCTKKMYKLKITPHVVSEAVKKAVKQLHGDFGLACISSSLSVKYYNVYTNLMIIRVLRKFEEKVSSSLAFAFQPLKVSSDKDSNECPFFLHTLHVSGTIRSAQKVIIRWNKRMLSAEHNKN